MTQNKSNHLPPEQSKNLPIKIDTEYVWIRINKKWELSSYKSLDAYIKLGMSNKLLPAPTLEELLALLPKEICTFRKYIVMFYKFGAYWQVRYVNRAMFSDEFKTVEHKDPKLAVTAMIQWLFENNYLKELTNAK